MQWRGSTDVYFGAWLGKRAEAEQPAAEIVDKVGSEVVIIERLM